MLSVSNNPPQQLLGTDFSTEFTLRSSQPTSFVRY
jgi:hypothetical protein